MQRFPAQIVWGNRSTATDLRGREIWREIERGRDRGTNRED